MQAIKRYPSISIGGVEVGDNLSPAFIAELGNCYEGSLDVAFSIIRAAKEAGAQLSKLECFLPEEVYRMQAIENQYVEYATAQGPIREKHTDLLSRKHLHPDEYAKIIQFSNSISLPCFATVYDLDMLARVVSYGAVAIKISSPNIVHLPLIAAAAKTGLPVVIDTNFALLKQVAEAVYAARSAGGKEILIMHNTPGRPSPAKNQNLRIIETYKNVLRVPVGFTCHYRGEDMLYAVSALNADAIEKPISRDPEKGDLEHYYSLAVDDMRTVIKKCDSIWTALGKDVLEPEDVPKYIADRMSPCAKRDIHKGEMLNLENVTFKRPCRDITGDSWQVFDGKRVARDIKKDELIQYGHIELNIEEDTADCH